MTQQAVVTVPPITFDQREWRPSVPELFSNAEVRRQTGEYRSAKPVTLAEWTAPLDAETSANIAEAALALREFDLYVASALGSGVRAFAPMSAILLRTESASSSQIEKLTASARQIALAQIGEGKAANALSVVGNVHALESALALADELTLDRILEMHRVLMQAQPDMRQHAGQLRTELVWIGGRDSAGPIGATYIAPEHNLVKPALNDLLAFADRADLPTLLLIAVAHAQFETIHPFVDGNGRTGRALVQSMLRRSGLATHSTVPISAGILRDTERYFAALGAFRAGDAGPIVTVFCDSARYAASSGRVLVDALASQLENAQERASSVRSDSLVWRILPLLIAQPVINARFVKMTFGAGDATTARAIRQLAELGILRERTGNARNRVWQHDGILDVLDEYAAQLRRA